MMRVLVAGTRSFGIACTDALMRTPGVTVRGVVAPHDDTLASWAAHKGLLRASAVTEAVVRDADVDLIVGAHCHDYIGKRSRHAARLGALIGHPSLLPRHRGRDAVEWTIRMRDPIAGFTWFLADSGIDTGQIVTQDFCHVRPGWTASDLWREELFPRGVDLLTRTVPDLEFRQLTRQDPLVATWEPALDGVPNLHRTELPELDHKPHSLGAMLLR
jgi:methionyl-tRNA formyltransferase